MKALFLITCLAFAVDMAYGGKSWVENAEWMYGGVSRDGFIPHWAPICACWNSRGALDYFGRSFVTELGRSCVAVLDTNGNLIMRVGRYGNVDDGVPLVKTGGRISRGPSAATKWRWPRPAT